MLITQQESLKNWTWWKIGGLADYFCLPESIDQVLEAVRIAQGNGLPITVLGGGSNVLVSDLGVEGLVIALKKFTGLEVLEESGRLTVNALAGTPKSELTKLFLQRKMAPALFLCGLPGDIGGGVVMNAGVSENITPREFVEITDWVEWVDLSTQDLSIRRGRRDELKWEYRASHGWQPGIVLRVGVSWPLISDPDIPIKVKAASKNRIDRQPLELPSGGSTFKNPLPERAGALIERAGLKGYQIGGAQVSMKHANFIVNRGGASAKDVQQVILHIQAKVQEKFNIDLQPEVKLVGRW